MSKRPLSLVMIIGLLCATESSAQKGSVPAYDLAPLLGPRTQVTSCAQTVGVPVSVHNQTSTRSTGRSALGTIPLSGPAPVAIVEAWVEDSPGAIVASDTIRVAVPPPGRSSAVGTINYVGRCGLPPTTNALLNPNWYRVVVKVSYDGDPGPSNNRQDFEVRDREIDISSFSFK